MSQSPKVILYLQWQGALLLQVSSGILETLVPRPFGG